MNVSASDSVLLFMLYLVMMDEAGEGWGVELDQNSVPASGLNTEELKTLAAQFIHPTIQPEQLKKRCHTRRRVTCLILCCSSLNVEKRANVFCCFVSFSCLLFCHQLPFKCRLPESTLTDSMFLLNVTWFVEKKKTYKTQRYAPLTPS